MSVVSVHAEHLPASMSAGVPEIASMTAESSQPAGTAERISTTHPSSAVDAAQSDALALQAAHKAALEYLEKVKSRFSATRWMSDQFLGILREFQSRQIDTEELMKRIKLLLRGNLELLVGFNQFLPPGYRIELQSNQVEWQTAVDYIADVKRRFIDEPYIYAEFLDIVHHYNEQKAKTMGVQSKETVAEMCQRVRKLFDGHPDLVEAFKCFLPPDKLPLEPGASASIDNRSAEEQAAAAPKMDALLSLAAAPPSTAASSSSTTAAASAVPVAVDSTASSPPSSTSATPAAAPSVARPQPKMADALAYLESVKQRFAATPSNYLRFLDIMKDFKTQQIDTKGVIRSVRKLFGSDRTMLLGFNQFLPLGFSIDPDAVFEEEEPIEVSKATDIASKETSAATVAVSPAITAASSSSSSSSSSSPSALPPSLTPPRPPENAPLRRSGRLAGKPAVFEDAVAPERASKEVGSNAPEADTASALPTSPFQLARATSRVRSHAGELATDEITTILGFLDLTESNHAAHICQAWYRAAQVERRREISIRIESKDRLVTIAASPLARLITHVDQSDFITSWSDLALLGQTLVNLLYLEFRIAEPSDSSEPAAMPPSSVALPPRLQTLNFSIRSKWGDWTAQELTALTAEQECLIRSLPSAPGLTSVTLRGLVDIDLSPISTLTSLSQLHLNYQVPQRIVPRRHLLAIQSLHASLTDVDVWHKPTLGDWPVLHLPNVRMFSSSRLLFHSENTVGEIAAMSRALPSLEKLLVETLRVEDARALAEFGNLRRLTIGRSASRKNDAGAAAEEEPLCQEDVEIVRQALHKLKNLESFTLQSVHQLGPALDVRSLLQSWPQLTDLCIEAHDVDPSFLESPVAHRQLLGLSLRIDRLSLASLQGILSCTRLESLHLHPCCGPFTWDDLLSHFSSPSALPALRDLVLFPAASSSDVLVSRLEGEPVWSGSKPVEWSRRRGDAQRPDFRKKIDASSPSSSSSS